MSYVLICVNTWLQFSSFYPDLCFVYLENVTIFMYLLELLPSICPKHKACGQRNYNDCSFIILQFLHLLKENNNTNAKL